MLNKFLLCLL